MADFRPLTPEEVPAAAAPEAPVAARNWGLSHLPFTFKYEGSFPDALKIKKKLNLGPLQLSLAGVWERKSKDFYSKVSVKDRILRGKFSFRADDPTIEYKKRFSIPKRGVPGSIVASAAWRLNDYTWKPAVRLGFELSHGNQVVQMNTIATRRKFYFSETLGLEACSLLHVHLPQTLEYEWTGTSPGAINQDGFRLDLEVKQLNLVLKL